MQEQRHFTRIPHDARVDIRSQDRQWQAILIDISLKGALAAAPDDCPLQSGDTCDLTIHLSEDVHIAMQGHVAHREPGRLGVQCDHIDVDSISHLRRLLEVNTGNEEMLHRELNALGEQHK